MQDFSLAIATPSHYGNFCAEYVLGVFHLQTYCHDKDIPCEFLITTGISVVDYARNVLASRFLAKTQCSHMLFIDDDMGFNAEELARMFEWHRHEVVAAIYPKKTIDWKRIRDIVRAHPDIPPEALPHIAGNYVEMFDLVDPSGMTVSREPLPVNAIATGLMMISRRCLVDLIEKTKIPQLSTTDGIKTDYPVYEFFRTSTIDGKPMGEDFYFCNLVRQLGGNIYGCPWIPVTHVGKYTYIGDLPGIAGYM